MKQTIGNMTALLDKILFVRGTHCVECGRVLFSGNANLCFRCMKKLIPITPFRCAHCNSESGSGDFPLCRECLPKNLHLSAGESLYLYMGTAAKSVWDFKYNNNPDAIIHYANLLFEKLKDKQWFCETDIIACVPSGKEKISLRGYNQSEILGAEIARLAGKTFERKLLRLARETEDQIGLNYEERMDNVNGAFKVNGKISVTGKKILVADDVFTTGATLNACAEALAYAGASGVSYATVVTAPYK